MFNILPSYPSSKPQSYPKTRSSSVGPSQSYTISSPQQLSLQKKVNKIAYLNLKNHDLNICACEQCIYTRQLNRKHRIGLELSKNSSYRYQYNQHRKDKNLNQNNQTINYQKINKHKDNRSMIIENSNYGKDYFKDKGYDKPVRARPEDQLKFKGPVSSFSTTKQQYQAFKNNANPYVKPVQIKIQNTMKMNTKSSYQSNFNAISNSITQSGKINDHFHVGLPWTGKSSYREQFLLPHTNINNYQPSDNSRISHQTIDPNYKHQYQTSYRNQYNIDKKKRCQRSGQDTLNPLLLSLQSSMDL